MMMLRKLLIQFSAPASSRMPQFRPTCRQPEPPIGFVRRSDPQYYFLVRRSTRG